MQRGQASSCREGHCGLCWTTHGWGGLHLCLGVGRGDGGGRGRGGGEEEEEQEEETVFGSCYVAQVGSESKAFLFSLLTARVVGLYHTY